MNNLINFLDKSYTCFHAINNIKEKLENSGFISLEENSSWTLEEGKNYYVIRNASSIVAFKVPTNSNITGFNIVASHSDSPTYKLKPNATIKDTKNDYLKLNTEGYGGMIPYTWLDRPLGIAGRVFVEEDNNLVEKLVTLDETIVIPSVAIHLNRATEYSFNPQVDMLPVIGSSSKSFEDILYKYINKDAISTDLFLYNKEKAMLAGVDNEYLLSGRLDDLECAYASIEALLNADNKNISVSAIFNNEEVGSRSSNGAASTFLTDTLERISKALNLDYKLMTSGSFIVSADNAHAVHPNHPEKSDSTNMVYMNKGIVIKHQAGLSYTTDALSEAVFKKVCKDVNVPYQDYTNRSDIRGGSTLGAISQEHLSIPSVDIGLAQLAMHASYEMCGTIDIEYMVKALTRFFEIKFNKNSNNISL